VLDLIQCNYLDLRLILKEEYIGPLGSSVSALAMTLNSPYSRLSEITKEARRINADKACRAGRYFGSEAKEWLNFHSAQSYRSAREFLNFNIRWYVVIFDLSLASLRDG
jgi:addiction module HigA family antidote